MESVMGGYIIENKSAPWDKRFWVDIPSVGVKTFGDDRRARVFFTKAEAEFVNSKIQNKYTVRTVVTKRSDLYPSW